MGCRTARADSIRRPFREEPIRPVVLLVFAHDNLRARFAYQLAASGFTVVTDIADLPGPKPDVIVAELDAEPTRLSPITTLSMGNGLAGVPVIAVADDVGDRTRTLARNDGCVAVCLSTCSATVLSSGIDLVLGRRDR